MSSSTMLIIPGWRWLLSCLLFFYIACHPRTDIAPLKNSAADSLKEQQRIDEAYTQINSTAALIHTGDLITRTGNDFTSESLRMLNRQDKTYSHCGIASIENDSVFVYHALGGEFNPDQKIRRDALQLFAEPYDNRGIGIYRYDISRKDINALMLRVKNLFESGVMFDMQFDLQTDERMYCAEFVYKCYQNGTALRFTQSHINDFVFIGVDDLFKHPLCKPVKSIRY